MSEPMKPMGYISMEGEEGITLVAKSDALRYAAEEREEGRREAVQACLSICEDRQRRMAAIDSLAAAYVGGVLTQCADLIRAMLPPAQGEQEGKETT